MNTTNKSQREKLILERLSSINFFWLDEMSVIERKVKMAKYGLNPMLERENDDEILPIEIKNDNEELENYRKELGDFLKDDTAYIKLRDDERQMHENAMKSMEVHHTLWEQFQIKSKEGEIDRRQELPYDSFISTLPDSEIPQ